MQFLCGQLKNTMENYTKDLELSLNTLQSGGVLLYPTDTIWGLGCDATNEKAISKIFEIKKRSPSKTMIMLVDSVKMIENFVDNPSPLLLNEMENADSPTTGIFLKGKNLPSNLIHSDGSIAIRIASDDFCQALLQQFKKPIVSTSANISNQPSPQNFSEIDPALFKLVDYTVFFRRRDNSKKSPSHIIKINDFGELERIR